MMGHWTYTNEVLDISMFCGFLYVITCLVNGKKYIGCKLFRVKNGKSKGYRKEDWQDYTGSCKVLNADIEKYGKDKFTFEMVSVHKSKTDLRYQEAKMILHTDAILSKEFYNQWVCLKRRNKK